MSDKLKDIFKLNLGTRGGIKQFNNIVNKYIINKKEKKELFKEIKNINKGEDSFDDGMEYYKIDTKFFENLSGDIHTTLSNFFITSISNNGKLKSGAVYNIGEVVYMCGNAKIILYANVTAKNQLNSQLEEYGISLNNTSIFKPITAKEYYSLLD